VWGLDVFFNALTAKNDQAAAATKGDAWPGGSDKPGLGFRVQGLLHPTPLHPTPYTPVNPTTPYTLHPSDAWAAARDLV